MYTGAIDLVMLGMEADAVTIKPVACSRTFFWTFGCDDGVKSRGISVYFPLGQSHGTMRAGALDEEDPAYVEYGFRPSGALLTAAGVIPPSLSHHLRRPTPKDLPGRYGRPGTQGKGCSFSCDVILRVR